MPRPLFAFVILLIFYLMSVNVQGVNASGQRVEFFYGENDGGGALTCNSAKMAISTPTTCNFDDNGILTVGRAGWDNGTAQLDRNGGITGNCASSFIVNPQVTHQFNLTPTCLPGTGNSGGGSPDTPVSARKDATGTVLVDEWYADLPWHQKLSTKDSNLIDTPFVMPFEALPKTLCPSAATSTDKSRCMLRYGVVNVMALHRTDTLYKAGEAPDNQDCRDNRCVEVKLKIQRFHTLTDNLTGYQADIIRNNSWPSQDERIIPSLGFAVTEATIFAPSLPWYTGHYCAKTKDNIVDSVCYEDYFTTQLQAPADPSINETWLDDAPAIFVPPGNEKGYTRFCKSGSDSCQMILGKVDWLKNATRPEIADCGSTAIEQCRKEVEDKTASLANQFNASLSQFRDEGRYPWHETATDLNEQAIGNPFIGHYMMKRYSENGGGNPPASLFKATHYVLPKQCDPATYSGARQGKMEEVDRLSDCALNFEIHTSGFHDLWKDLWGGALDDSAVREISTALPGSNANQYGRTMFMYAGLPEQHVPVSFKRLDDGMSLHDKIYSASFYTQYLPMVNPDDTTLFSKSYTDAFWHAFFMSNHMNQTPDHFIRGIRGRTLWHNEFRSNIMYESAEHGSYLKGTKFEPILRPVDFPAGFQVKNATSPFHGNTCDACHIRNGSGVPLMPNGQLPAIHINKRMNPNFVVNRDYTYSNKELPAMKLVLFDLKDTSNKGQACDDDNNSVHKLPGSGSVYRNKIMNFYGDSLHVNQQNQLPTYRMTYLPIGDNDGYEIVDTTARGLSAAYQPRKIEIDQIDTGARCRELANKPENAAPEIWPKTCDEVSGASIAKAINGRVIGVMPLLGRRLGNTPLLEMIPDKVIMTAQHQQSSLTNNPKIAGYASLSPGMRNADKANYRSCKSGKLGSLQDDCYLGRFGWIGDRASLEDQIANAASVEMNITSSEGYAAIHSQPVDAAQQLRYKQTLCGPADATCQKSRPNSDITEQEIKDMATYQRWIGIPNRSEYQVASTKVQRGEHIFNRLQCSSCHLIEKIPFDADDNMLPDEDRAHLQKLQQNSKSDYPFVAYLGTDLLMHDMGYLSQVAQAPTGIKLRREDGTIKAEFKTFVQHIRTPPLKGLRFNRFVTDANHNNQAPIDLKDSAHIPGCDFLLHDGRACDAIEAAYLHDGPEIKNLAIIKGLNGLTAVELEQLRAFLYSL